MSYISDTSKFETYNYRPQNLDHGKIPKRMPGSPYLRGRERDRHGEPELGLKNNVHKRKRRSSSSMSYSSGSSHPDKQRRSMLNDGRSTRRRHSSNSPDTRGRHRSSYGRANNRRMSSRSNSMDRSQIALNRRSMTPVIPVRNERDMNSEKPRPQNRRKALDDDGRYERGYRDRSREKHEPGRQVLNGPSRPRDRSLSPFSKRLALTQAMNMGR